MDYINRLFTLSFPEIKIVHVCIRNTWCLWSSGGLFKILHVVIGFLYMRGMKLHCLDESVCFFFHQSSWALKYCSKQSLVSFQELLDNLLHSCRICLNIIVLYDLKNCSKCSAFTDKLFIHSIISVISHWFCFHWLRV